MMTQKERELYGIGANEKDELGQLIAYCMKLLDYNLTKDYVESIHNFYL